MNELELIAKVTAAILQRSLADEPESEGDVARFLLNRLTGRQVAQICAEILSEPTLRQVIKIRVPYELVDEALAQEFGLPQDILTEHKTTYWRHAPCEQRAIVIANTNDDQGQSLRDVTPLGARELKDELLLWCQVGSRGLPLLDKQIQYWAKALDGLRSSISCSLVQFASYVLRVREHIKNEGATLVDALGWALPALHLPKDSSFFRTISPQKLGHRNEWQKRFLNAYQKRGCFLEKQNPKREVIDEDDLRQKFEQEKSNISSDLHATIEAFIVADPGWSKASEQLAELEWEAQKISTLFEIKQNKMDLASLTLAFYEQDFQDVLTEVDTAYLLALKKRKAKEPLDLDKAFYEAHRQELSEKPSLKSKWDKFIYGAPIHCHDFLSGLLLAVSRLYDQVDEIQSEKSLHVRTQFSRSRSKWLTLNTDACHYFSIRYRGLQQLLGDQVTWDVHHLFDYPEFYTSEYERYKNKKAKHPRNTSASKKANEIKLFITLSYDKGGSQQQSEVQLIWKFNPDSIASKLFGDVSRLAGLKSPFLSPTIYLEEVSKKGSLQSLALEDTGTMQAQYRQERGTLIPTYEKNIDMAYQFKAQVKALSETHLSEEGVKAILSAWQSFEVSYQKGIQAWLQEGIHMESVLRQVESYADLLETLHIFATNDTVRAQLWEPVHKIGNFHIENQLMTILAPWHPLRLASLVIQSRQTTELIQKLLGESVRFSDARLYFQERLQEIAKPYYPEITAGRLGENKQPILLSMADSLYDYSLMERPVLEQNEKGDVYENPSNATQKVKDVVQRYLELLPHERASLDVVLFNCDNSTLPQHIIKELSELYANTDVICQVMLRHRDRNKLTALYKNLVLSTSQDDSSLITSEYTADFMSRFRIGILQDSPESQAQYGKPADIVFLQDVISHQAEEKWVPSPQQIDSIPPDLLSHVPWRWSKRKVAQKGEEKASSYLVSPIQPKVGLTYVRSIESLVKQHVTDTGYTLPVRQISMKNEATQAVLEEVHRVGEWVVNYDDLLDMRQLKNYGVDVIRYQQRRNDPRNLLISSTSSTQLLTVLIKRRLNELNLTFDAQQTKVLIQRIVEDAKRVSGDLVLRAAKRGNCSKELMGIVLSLALLQAEVGKDALTAIFSLDDYASWFGQKEQRIADILVLNPVRQGKNAQLNILISEAKYVDVSSLSASQKSSQNQLRDTVRRLQDAVDSESFKEDTELWLAKISDMLLEGVNDYSKDQDFGEDIEFWRQGIMERTIPICIRGYSHVFVTDPHDSAIKSQQIPVPHVKNCLQEIFNRNSIQKIFTAYADNAWEDIQVLRRELGDHISFETVRQPQREVVLSKPEEIEPSMSVVNKGDVEQPLSSIHDVKPESPVPYAHQKESLLQDDNWPPQFAMQWLMQNALNQVSEQQDVQLQETTVQTLSVALYGYDLPVKVLGARLTPNAILVRLKGSDQLTVDAVEKRRSQLLTTHALNVLSIMAQPGEIIVSIERPQRQVISTADSWLRRKVNTTRSGLNMSLLIGVKEMDGELLYLNVGGEFEGLQQHAPHTLIAGATGSGKSVLLQNLILDIALTNPPHLAHIHLIDPKGIDYMHLDDLPHIHQGIIYEREPAVELLEQLVNEMDRRYVLFREQKAGSLDAYNTKVSEDKQLPVIWLVHDEFADWMMVDEYKQAVTNSVSRLGVKARAAGIYLVFAAQRPDANVLPLQLRENLGNRLILRVESTGTSKIALGQDGAEKLLGKGHLITRLVNEPNLIYGQVPFLSSSQIEALTQVIAQSYTTSTLA